MAINQTRNENQGSGLKTTYPGQLHNRATAEPTADGMSNQQQGQGMGDQSGQVNRPSTEISGYKNSEMASAAAKSEIKGPQHGAQQFDEVSRSSEGYAPEGKNLDGSKSRTEADNKTGLDKEDPSRY